jgi:hypothetical protein
MHQLFKFIFGMKLCVFRTVPLSIIRSFSPYTQQWYMSYWFADSLRAGSGCLLTACNQDQDIPSWSCLQAVSKPVWHIPLLCVQWKTPDDGQRNCPKHVEFHSKNKIEKLVHLVGLIKKSTVTCIFSAAWLHIALYCYEKCILFAFFFNMDFSHTFEMLNTTESSLALADFVVQWRWLKSEI